MIFFIHLLEIFHGLTVWLLSHLHNILSGVYSIFLHMSFMLLYLFNYMCVESSANLMCT